MMLVGIIKYAERTLCLYRASERKLRDSMLSPLEVSPIYPRQMEHFTLKNEEGYWVGIDEVTQMPGSECRSYSVQAGDKEMVKAYKFFNIFKLLFAGLTINFVDRDFSQRMFMDRMNPSTAFEIVEIELGFMYDLLFTKTPLLKCAWGIIRWAINLSMTCAVLVFFSLQDKKGYSVVDVYVTILLMSVTILLEIYALLLAISSDWVNHWWLQRTERSTISFAIALLRFSPSQRWSNSVAQLSLLRSSIRKRNSIFRHPWFAKLHEVVEENFYIRYQEFDDKIKELIFHRMAEVAITLEEDVQSGLLRTVKDVVGTAQLKSALLKLQTRKLLMKTNCDLMWAVDMEFDQNILIWDIATELRYYEDSGGVQQLEENARMSMFISQYMLYLLVFHPSMLPTGRGVVPYEDTLVEAQKFFDEELAMMSNDNGGSSISSVVIEWAHKFFKKEAHVHTHLHSCSKEHESRELRNLCEVCWLLLQVGTELPAWKMCGAKSTSMLFDACRLADQLTSVDTWDIISKVWVRMLMYAACQCKGSEHCDSLSRGGELLSHVWLLMAHLGIAQPVKTSGASYVAKLIVE